MLNYNWVFESHQLCSRVSHKVNLEVRVSYIVDGTLRIYVIFEDVLGVNYLQSNPNGRGGSRVSRKVNLEVRVSYIVKGLFRI